MATQVSGKITKNREKAAIFTRMEKNTMVNGPEIKNLETAHTSTRMEMFILEDGRMTEDPEKER